MYSIGQSDINFSTSFFLSFVLFYLFICFLSLLRIFLLVSLFTLSFSSSSFTIFNSLSFLSTLFALSLSRQICFRPAGHLPYNCCVSILPVCTPFFWTKCNYWTPSKDSTYYTICIIQIHHIRRFTTTFTHGIKYVLRVCHHQITKVHTFCPT